MRFLAILSILFCMSAFAAGQNAPRGWWQCSFWGQEWQMTPGPGGPRWELQPRTYTSDWKQTRQAAYDEAADECDQWSDTGCNFSSCRQKAR